MARKPLPCKRCGVNPKVPGSGKVYCTACYEWHGSTLRERTNARTVARRDAARTGVKGARRMNKFAPPGTRWCSYCSQYFTLAQFSKRGTYCKACTGVAAWEYTLKKKFGITVEQYDSILEHQGGACFICGTIPKRKRLAVDHDHKTGNIRGLLCTVCNHRVLGGSKDRSDILRRAADYLDSPPAFDVIGEVVVPE